METRKLGKTGLEVSILGYGASSLGGVFGEVRESDGVACVHRALELGINFIDCSPYYGLTKAETVLGKAFQGVPREDYILATKVGRYGENDFDFSRARVLRSVEESCARLGVDAIDIIQCHDIEYVQLRQIVDETLPALRELQTQGVVRFVGVTGLPLRTLRWVAERAPLDTVLSYCRYTLCDTGLAEELSFFESLGIGVISASPLAMGLLTEAPPPPWHPAPQEIQDACTRAAAFCRERGKNISRLALQFAVKNPAIATTLVGTAQAEQIEQNVRWMEEPLDEELLARVLEILHPIHNRSWPSGRSENND